MLDLQDTIGFALIGAILASTLYGLSIAQTVFYFKKYPGDRISLKMLVIFLLLVDTAKEVVIAQDAFFYLIQVHGNPLYLAEVPRSFGACVSCLLNKAHTNSNTGLGRSLRYSSLSCSRVLH